VISAYKITCGFSDYLVHISLFEELQEHPSESLSSKMVRSPRKDLDPRNSSRYSMGYSPFPQICAA